MTLGDFLTLTEINNGLTSPSRVRELVAAMQNEKDSNAQNGVDSTRQWSAVATAIAATDRKECLDLFIQLDGLHFLDNWLKSALNLSCENTFVEDLVTLLIQAIEKLPVDYEKLVASGILITLENLLVHNSSKVQDKARDIYQRWKINSDGDIEKNIGAFSDHEVGRTEDTETGNRTSEKDAALVEVRDQESVSDDLALATFSECVASHVEAAESIGKSLDPPSGDNRTLDAEPCNQAVLESTCDIKHTTKIENSSEKEISLEESNPVTSCSDATDAKKSENERPFSNVDKDLRDKDSLYIMSNATDTEKNSAVDCNGYVDQSTTPKAFSPKTDGDFQHPILRRSSSTEKSLTNNYNLNKNEIVSKNASGIELEAASQVAMEVASQVDYKEQSCSSPEKVEVSNAPRPDSLDVTNRKESPASEGSEKHMEIDQIYTSPTWEDSAASAKTLDTERVSITPDMESSQVTETAQAEVNNSEKEVLGNFDLNQEVFSEDINDPSNQFPAPVSAVSASKAKAAPEQPAVPLQFEGNLGWKGSASTSAFRPASPRRMLANDMASSSGSSSKQRQMCFDIDLNVAESVDEESCLDTNSRKYEHLELDLNHASEDDGPSDWQIGQLFPQGNSHQSRSHSSSSSVKQPSLMNFDLNGQPSFLNGSSYLSKLSQNHNVSEGIKSDDSVISIMGTRVQVNRKDVASQVHPLLNGQKPELGIDLNLGRSGNNVLRIGSAVPYTHTPFYGYNNNVPGSEHAPVFSPAFYGSGGPIPYMVDARGAPVIPQLVGSVSALPTTYTQPPFVVNVNSSNPLNGIGPSGPSGSSFNPNYGMVVESGSGEPVGFRQFLSSGHIGPMGEQIRPEAQPTVSSVGGKRKVSETEWVNYPPRQYMHWK